MAGASQVTEVPLAAAASAPPRRGTQAVMTPMLAAALDRAGVSDRFAVLLIASVALSLGIELGTTSCF